MVRRTVEGKRTHVIVPTRDLEQLDKLQVKTGMTLSEMIRRAIRTYIDFMTGGRK